MRARGEMVLHEEKSGSLCREQAICSRRWQRSQMGPRHLIKLGVASGVQVVEKKVYVLLCIVSYRSYVQEADPSILSSPRDLLFFHPSAAPLHQVEHKKKSGRRARWMNETVWTKFQ